MKHIFFGGLALALFAACADPAPARKRSAECYVRYLAPEGQLLAETTLREAPPGQSALETVEAPDGVRYNGTLMRVVPGRGIRYQLEQPSGYNARHTFAWNAGPQAFSLQIDLPPVAAFSFGTGPVSRLQPDTLRWTGDPLGQGESLVLMWESVDGRLTLPMEIAGTPGQKMIVFPAAQLAKLVPGDWALYLVRKKRLKTEQHGTTLYGLAEFYTTVDTLSVE